MLRHIVFFTARNPEDADAVFEGLSLLKQVPDCLHLEVGRNIEVDVLNQKVPHFVVYGEFEDAQQLAAFKAHPIYQEAIDVVRPLREMRIAADFLA